MKILIVDDEAVIREGLAVMLGDDYSGNHAIYSAASGFDGIEQALRIKPDVLLVDINMPAMDGLSMIAELQSRNFHSHYIILTGYDEYSYAIQALRLRVFDYLLKPVDQEALFRLLDQICKTLIPMPTDQKPMLSAAMADADLKKVSHNTRAILSFIRKNYKEIQSVDQIAQFVYLHPNYISVLFRKEIGVSIIHYINAFRVERAKELLLQDDMITMESVAEMVGFQTARNFYKVFKDIIGISPGKYRTQGDGSPVRLL